VLGQAFLGTAILGVLAGIGCTLAAWLLPDIADHFSALTAKKKILTEIASLIPYFIWSMLPLALGNVFVAALLAQERYRAVPWLVGIAVTYGLTLAWLAGTLGPGTIPWLVGIAVIYGLWRWVIPHFIWSIFPLALGNAFVAALLARERYRAVPWLVGIAVIYGLILAWLANTAEPPSQQTIILTLGGFNLAFLGTSAALAKRYAASPESR
jgi:hypothetical protein